MSFHALRGSERYVACSDEVMAPPPIRHIQNVSVTLYCALYTRPDKYEDVRFRRKVFWYTVCLCSFRCTIKLFLQRCCLLLKRHGFPREAAVPYLEHGGNSLSVSSFRYHCRQFHPQDVQCLCPPVLDCTP